MNDRYRYGDQRPGNPTLAYTRMEQLRDIQKKLPLRVLSAEDFAHWQRYGYVVIKQAVPREQVERTVDFLWQFQELDRSKPDTWNRSELRSHEMKELNGSGMVEAYHHQTLWDNRQTQRVYDAFVDIWDQEDLWVSIDRANLNTPNRGARQFAGFIHWDADTTLEPMAVNSPYRTPQKKAAAFNASQNFLSILNNGEKLRQLIATLGSPMSKVCLGPSNSFP
jgi:hypothetical protein